MPMKGMGTAAMTGMSLPTNCNGVMRMYGSARWA